MQLWLNVEEEEGESKAELYLLSGSSLGFTFIQEHV